MSTFSISNWERSFKIYNYICGFVCSPFTSVSFASCIWKLCYYHCYVYLVNQQFYHYKISCFIWGEYSLFQSLLWLILIYSWLLNNTSLKCMGPLICRFFSINTFYSTTRSVVGWVCGCRTADTEGQLWSYTQIFNLARVGAPSSHVVQGLIVAFYAYYLYDIYF